MPIGQKRSVVKPEAVLKQIHLLESLDTSTNEAATLTLSTWLLEGNGISQILKYYISCQSIRALELLSNHIHEPFDKILLDQISDWLQKNPSVTIILLGRLLNNGSVWLSKIPQHEIFSRILELIKAGKNLEHVNSALLLLSSLLPYCPPNESTVKDLFRCFLDTCKLYYQKNKSATEKLKQAMDNNNKSQLDSPFVMSNIVCLMQIGAIQSSLQILFTSLYGIYPNTIMTLLQKCIQTSGISEFFTTVLEPIILSCRINPHLLLDNREKEFSVERWKERQANELYGLCEKVSINGDLLNDKTSNLSFKQQLDNNIYGIQNDLNALDNNTLSYFKKGCQSFGLANRQLNRFGLETPPNEIDALEYSETDLFGNINLEKFLNNSLTNNSNSSINYSTRPKVSQFSQANQGREEVIRSTPSKHSANINVDAQQSTKHSANINVDAQQSTKKHIKKSLKRSSSQPNIEPAQLKTSTLQVPLSVAKLLKDFVKMCSKENSIGLAKEKTEELRNDYMTESQNYHERLKLLKLVDRLPGKIYDDLHIIMKGMSVENQRDLLESRLRLVNNHLMFERSCRLLLARQSQHLSKRLKNQSFTSNSTDNERLLQENKQLRSQINQMNPLLQELHVEKTKLFKKLDEKEHFYLAKVQKASATIDELNVNLEELKQQFTSIEQHSQRQQKRLESLLLNGEQKLMDSHIVESQHEELQQLRYELSISQEQNQNLRDHCEKMANNQKQVPNEQLGILAKNSDLQIKSLKIQLQKNQEKLEKLNEKYKQLEYNYTNGYEQRIELEASIIRAAKLYAMQIKSANHNYESLLTICNKQEAHIAYLYGIIKKSSNKDTSARKSNSSFKEIFTLEDPSCDDRSNQGVEEHLRDLFGSVSNDKLELIDRQSDFASIKKASDYVPSSSLDTTFVPIELRHKRRCSLTTLPISEFNLNANDKHEEELTSSKEPSETSFKLSRDLPHYFPFNQ